MRPISQVDGCESFRELNEPFPGLAGGVHAILTHTKTNIGTPESQCSRLLISLVLSVIFESESGDEAEGNY